MNHFEAHFKIMQLKGAMEHVLFKEFLQHYDLPEGLNPTHVMTLMSLMMMGPIQMSELSKRLNLEKGSFTPVANKLIKKGLIKKERSEVDLRVYELSLTDSGIEMAKNFGSAHMNYTKGLLDKLDDKEAFIEAIAKVTAGLEKLSPNMFSSFEMKDFPKFPPMD